MPGTHGRRIATLFGTIMITLILSAPTAGAQTEPDCEDAPIGIGCGQGPTTTAGGNTGNESTTTTERDPAVPPGRPNTTTTSTTTTEAAPADEGEETGGDQPDESAVDTDSDDGGISPLFAFLAGALGLGAGFAAGAAVMAARRQDTGAPRPAVAAAVPAAAATDNLDGAQRGRLVHELINVRDQVTSEALKASIGATLAEVGVSEVVVAPGSPFDPQRHKGVDRVPTTDASLDRTVAEMERPGYVDRNQVLRLPEVVVHRLDGQEPSP